MDFTPCVHHISNLQPGQKYVFFLIGWLFIKFMCLSSHCPNIDFLMHIAWKLGSTLDSTLLGSLCSLSCSAQAFLVDVLLASLVTTSVHWSVRFAVKFQWSFHFQDDWEYMSIFSFTIQSPFQQSSAVIYTSIRSQRILLKGTCLMWLLGLGSRIGRLPNVGAMRNPKNNTQM